MKRLKTYNKFSSINERYRYIDSFDFTDSEIEKLNQIETLFNQIPKEDIEECVIDLENLGLNYYKGVLVSFLWKGETLDTGRVHTSYGERFDYFLTSDFYKTGDNIFSKNTFKMLNSEMLDTIWYTKTTSEIEQLFGNDVIKRHFKNSIIEEIEKFDRMIEDGYMPCVGVCNLKSLKGWTLNQNKVDVLYEFRERVKGICGYELIFVPTINEPSLILVDKKYINK